MASVGRYAAVLRTPHVARTLAASLVARLPSSMATLSILLLISPTHGYGLAGLASAAYVGGCGLTNPLQAALIDRGRPRRVLLPAAALFLAGMIALALVPGHDFGWQLAVAGFAGLATPPSSAVARGLWPRLLEPDAVTALYGLEATAQELIWIVGPTLAATIADVAGARVATAMTGLIGFSGIVVMVASPALAARPRAARGQGRINPLKSLSLQAYCILAGTLTLGFGMTEVGAVAFVHGGTSKHTALPGVMLAMWATGSMIGGLVFAGRGGQVDDRGLLRAGAAIAIAMSITSLAVGWPGLGLLLLVAGVSIAPGMAKLYTRVGAAAPDGAETESFGWLAVAFMTGAALGSSIGGLVVDGLGARLDLLLGAAPAAFGVAVAASMLRVGSTAATGQSLQQLRRVPDAPVASRT